jgi:hypothetical protein
MLIPLLGISDLIWESPSPVIRTRAANKLVGTLGGNWKLGTLQNLDLFLCKGVCCRSSARTCLQSSALCNVI